MTTEIQALINAIETNNTILKELCTAVVQVKMHQLGEKPKHGLDAKKKPFIELSPLVEEGSVLNIDGKPSEHTSISGVITGISVEESVYKDSTYGSGKYQMMFVNIQAGSESYKLRVGRSNKPSVCAKTILLALSQMSQSQLNDVTFEFSKGSTGKNVVLCQVEANGETLYISHPKFDSDDQRDAFWRQTWQSVIDKFDVEIISKIKAEDKPKEVKQHHTFFQPIEKSQTNSEPVAVSLANLVMSVREKTGHSKDDVVQLLKTRYEVNHPSKLTSPQLESLITDLLWGWYYSKVPEAAQNQDKAYDEFSYLVSGYFDSVESTKMSQEDYWLGCFDYLAQRITEPVY